MAAPLVVRNNSLWPAPAAPWCDRHWRRLGAESEQTRPPICRSSIQAGKTDNPTRQARQQVSESVRESERVRGREGVLGSEGQSQGRLVYPFVVALTRHTRQARQQVSDRAWVRIEEYREASNVS